MSFDHARMWDTRILSQPSLIDRLMFSDGIAGPTGPTL